MRHARHFRPVGRINTACRFFGIVGIAGNTATIKARDALATCRLVQAWRSLPVPLLCAANVLLLCAAGFFLQAQLPVDFFERAVLAVKLYFLLA